MAKNKKMEIKEKLAIYAILFGEHNALFVGRCNAENLRRTYGTHYYLDNEKTKWLFEEEREKGQLPPVYLLETVEATKDEALCNVIAWNRLFMDQGLESVSGKGITRHAYDMGEGSDAVYQRIKNLTLEDVCVPEGGLYPDFGKRKQQGKNKAVLTIHLTPEQYDLLYKRARACNMSMSEYSRAQIRGKRKVVVADNTVFEPLFEVFAEMNRETAMAEDILQELKRTGDYSIVELRDLAARISENDKAYLKAVQDVVRTMRALAEEDDTD